MADRDTGLITNTQGRNELGSTINTSHQGNNMKRPTEEKVAATLDKKKMPATLPSRRTYMKDGHIITEENGVVIKIDGDPVS